MKAKIAACLAMFLGVILVVPKSASAIYVPPIPCRHQIKVTYDGPEDAVRLINFRANYDGVPGSFLRLRVLPFMLENGDSRKYTVNLIGLGECSNEGRFSPGKVGELEVTYVKCEWTELPFGRPAIVCNPLHRFKKTMPLIKSEEGVISAVLR